MKKNRKFLVAAGGVLAAMAASGGAFTASLTTTADSSEVVSAGTVSVDGATVLAVDYAHDGTNITSATVTYDAKYAAGTVFELWIGSNKFTAGTAAVVEADGDALNDETRVVFSGSEAIANSTSTRIAVNGDVTA